MLKPVHALVGTDLFLQLDTLAGLLKQAPPDVQRTDFDGDSAQLADVLDELKSFAMFSSSKFVIVRTAEEFITRFREQLENYISHPAGNSTLVLRCSSLPKNQRVYKQIEKVGQVHDCTAPKDVSAWVVKRGKEHHTLDIGREAASILADHVGDDLGRLDNELAKLALQTDGKVDPKSIAKSVAFQREQEMWDMTDEVAAGHITAAVRRWRQLVQLDPSTEYRAVTWLTMWLEKVRKALVLKRQGLNEFAIAKELRIWPAEKAKPLLQNATALGDDGAGRLIELLAEVDKRSKSGLGDMADNVEHFLLSVPSRK